MRDKDKFDDNLDIDDEFEIEFEEDDEYNSEFLNSKSNPNKISADEEDLGEEESDQEFRVDFEYEDYIDDSDKKIKLSKNQIINRIMAVLGVVIAGFTVFYGIVAFGALSGDKDSNDVEEETNVVQEETTEQQEGEFFISTNTDENISDEVKKLLNDEELTPMTTGLSKADKLANEIISLTCKDDMTTYENVRNIYDYMMYYFQVKSTSYVDTDTIYEYCSSMDYLSDYDMELVYRAAKLFKDKTGDSKDYACGFTVLLRNLGLKAYYIDGEMIDEEDDYESHGYTIVMLDDEMYIFDVAQEDEETNDNTNKVEYKVFCKTFEELDDMYSYDGVEDSIDAFGKFATLAKLTLSVKATTDDGDYTSASVSYGKDDNVAVLDSITIDLYDNVYLSGSVSGSTTNTWKLIVRVYDSDMDYITESTLYNETTYTGRNEVTYRAGRGGYMKLLYVVTDENGRTCTASIMVKVNAPEEEITTTREVEENTTTDEVDTDDSESVEQEEPPSDEKPKESNDNKKPEESADNKKPEETNDNKKPEESGEESEDTEEPSVTEETTILE